MTRPFSVTWDYRCPFARNLHEHVLLGLEAGAGWDVRSLPFSLGQVHVAEGEPDVWERPEGDSGLLALQVGVAVRDAQPERFPELHRRLFRARHDEGRDLRSRPILDDVIEEAGADAALVWELVDGGTALATVRKEHEAAATEHGVWGVPTIIAGDDAVFVRVMDRPDGDVARARGTIDRLVDLLTEWPELNEFKHSRLPR